MKTLLTEIRDSNQTNYSSINEKNKTKIKNWNKFVRKLSAETNTKISEMRAISYETNPASINQADFLLWRTIEINWHFTNVGLFIAFSNCIVCFLGHRFPKLLLLSCVPWCFATLQYQCFTGVIHFDPKYFIAYKCHKQHNRQHDSLWWNGFGAGAINLSERQQFTFPIAHVGHRLDGCLAIQFQ